MALPSIRPRWKQAVLSQEIDHVAVEQPGLLDLAGVSSPRQHLQFAVLDPLLKRKGLRVGGVLAAGQDDRRAGDLRLMILRVRRRMRLELMDDRVDVAEFVALAEHVGEERRQRRGAERRAQIVEGVAPAEVDAVFLVVGDAAMGEFFARLVSGAREDQRRRSFRLEVVHVVDDRGADRAADQDRLLARRDLVDRLPAALRDVVHGDALAALRRAPVARHVDGDAAVPGGHLRHLENPARLVHRVGMHEGHHRPGTAHALVVQRSVDVLSHVVSSFASG